MLYGSPTSPTELHEMGMYNVYFYNGYIVDPLYNNKNGWAFILTTYNYMSETNMWALTFYGIFYRKANCIDHTEDWIKMSV